MSKAFILVKSDQKSTYEEVLNQIKSSGLNITSIIWVFLEQCINKEIIPRAPSEIQEICISIQKIDELKQRLTMDSPVRIIDISGLPKEHTLQVFTAVMEYHNVTLYTISRSKENPYVDLTNQPVIINFRKKYSYQQLMIKVIFISFIVSIISYFFYNKIDPNLLANPDWSFYKWLGVIASILGIVGLSFFTIFKK